jgi:hypothetical protein
MVRDVIRTEAIKYTFTTDLSESTGWHFRYHGLANRRAIRLRRLRYKPGNRGYARMWENVRMQPGKISNLVLLDKQIE